MLKKIIIVCSMIVYLGTGVKVITGFDSITSPSQAVSQQDLSSFGVAAAPMSIVTDNTDTGKGLMVTLGSVSSRYCQSLGISDHARTAEVFSASSGSDFIRIWIYNPDAQDIGICIQLTSGSKTAMLDPENAVLTRSDGKNITIRREDLSGIGSKYHLIIPPGFAGWAAWPVNSELRQAWSYPLLENISEVSDMRLDIRPKAPASSDHYVIDDICIADTHYGTLREYIDPLNVDIEETKQELLTMFAQYTDTTPRKIMLPEYDPDSHPDLAVNEWSSIKALTYDGALFDGKKTKVFAYIGFPEGADASSKCPAVVLVHGGGGHPFAEWIKIWNDRGYAAIAMDTTGYFPSPEGKGKAGRESDFYQTKPYWQYGLYGQFAESGYVNAPNNDSLNSAGATYDKQWMYHAVSQVILAHNILRNEPVIDAERTGLVGISWGGVISSITIGYDSRFSFAVPIYGTGHLDKSLTYMKDYFSPEPAKSLWSASDRFSLVDIPVLWLCWANDPSFSVQSNSRSYTDTRKAGAILSVIANWSHGHSSGWQQKETYRFADSVTKNKAGLTQCLTEPEASRNFDFLIRKSSDAVSVSAKAYYLTEEMTYSMNGILSDTQKMPTIDQVWKTLICKTDGDIVFGTLPENAYSFYVEIDTQTKDGHFITTTRFVEKITGEGEQYSGSSYSVDSIPDLSGETSVTSSDPFSSSSTSSVSDVPTSTEVPVSSSDPQLSEDTSLPVSASVSQENEQTGRYKGWLYTALAVVSISVLILFGVYKWGRRYT